MQRVLYIVLNTLPILLMVGLIPLISNDYMLTATYCVIIICALLYKREKNDMLALGLGFVAMIFFEYIFVSTGVETFTRNSLFGIMPLWLPFLWAYGFVVIKRSTEILNK